MGKRIEECRCCEAVARIFEARYGEGRRDEKFPEEEDRQNPTVEYSFIVGRTRYWVEHTLIEPFDGFIGSNRYFSDFLDGFDDLVAQSIPNDHAFQLAFPIDALSGLKNRDITRTRKAVAECAIASMASLANPMPVDGSIAEDITTMPTSAWHDGDTESCAKILCDRMDVREARKPKTYITARPDGVHFDVTISLVRQAPPQWIGKLNVLRSVTGELESGRIDRIRRALTEKSKKLQRIKSLPCGDIEDKTVLVLENNDLALSNDHLIFDALKDAMASTETHADHIFIISTCTATYYSRHLVDDGCFNDG